MINKKNPDQDGRMKFSLSKAYQPDLGTFLNAHDSLLRAELV